MVAWVGQGGEGLVDTDEVGFVVGCLLQVC